MTEAELVERAREVAKAAGEYSFMFGVRAHQSGSVFAACGDVECDADTFENALEGVLKRLQDHVVRERSAARKVMEQAERLLSLSKGHSTEDCTDDDCRAHRGRQT